jgi:hypothetical protein
MALLPHVVERTTHVFWRQRLGRLSEHDGLDGGSELARKLPASLRYQNKA